MHFFSLILNTILGINALIEHYFLMLIYIQKLIIILFILLYHIYISLSFWDLYILTWSAAKFTLNGNRCEVRGAYTGIYLVISHLGQWKVKYISSSVSPELPSFHSRCSLGDKVFRSPSFLLSSFRSLSHTLLNIKWHDLWKVSSVLAQRCRGAEHLIPLWVSSIYLLMTQVLYYHTIKVALFVVVYFPPIHFRFVV